ncbi:heterokaryon incompatibility protein-domain-containing protein [Camillea tinctor]|nr:heterokaryon incompatibility protein-domain-containing protein [Camillea tinctor]
MRLLNVHTEKLHQFFDANTPPYAILSHTWSSGGNDEVTFRDVNPDPCPWHTPPTDADAEPAAVAARYRNKPTYVPKVHGCCRQALANGLEWIWIDTCCIDKSSSSELQESINSMYRWYERARVCYAYLADVDITTTTDVTSALQQSRWFTRGWTLQELIAPEHIEFFDCAWRPLGERGTLTAAISARTRVGEKYLRSAAGRRVYVQQLAGVAEKMSWAAGRVTTRQEDIAYCLLGLFGVAMPMLYGEGGPRAFARLQEEIMRRSKDQSILLAGYRIPRPLLEGGSAPRWIVRAALASSPDKFRFAGDVRTKAPERLTDSFTMGQRGLAVHLPVYKNYDSTSGGYDYCVLNCGVATGPQTGAYRLVAIPLVPVSHGGPSPRTPTAERDSYLDLDREYARLEMQIPILAPARLLGGWPSRTFFLRRVAASRAVAWPPALALGAIRLPPRCYTAGIWPPQSHPHEVLEIGKRRDGHTFQTYDCAFLHIACARRGVLVMIEPARKGDDLDKPPSDFGSTSFLRPSEGPCVDAWAVPRDFCVIEAPGEALVRSHYATKTDVTRGEPIKLLPVRDGFCPVKRKRVKASGVVMAEHVRRGDGRAYLDIELVDDSEEEEGKGEGVEEDSDTEGESPTMKLSKMLEQYVKESESDF